MSWGHATSTDLYNWQEQPVAIACTPTSGIFSGSAVIDYENQSSVAFHEQFGFTNVGIIKESGYKFERWLHSVIMQLILK